MTRPRGEIREVLARGLQVGAGHTRELALRTGVGVTAARRTLDNMRRAGEAVVLREVRMQGVRRPVPVYGLAGTPDAPAPAAAGLAAGCALVSCWARCPAEA